MRDPKIITEFHRLDDVPQRLFILAGPVIYRRQMDAKESIQRIYVNCRFHVRNALLEPAQRVEDQQHVPKANNPRNKIGSERLRKLPFRFVPVVIKDRCRTTPQSMRRNKGWVDCE